MRTILGAALCRMLVSQALAAPVEVIPNGGGGVGSLSVMNAATGRVEHNWVTAIAPTQPTSEITNDSFAIANAAGSAAVLSLQQSPGSHTVHILSAVNLTTGRITAHRELSLVARKEPVMVAANPQASVLYLGYGDKSGNFHIQALDPVTLHATLEADLGADRGRNMIVSPDGQTIYLTSAHAVTAVEASNLKPIGKVALSDEWDAVVSPDSSTLYVAAGKYPDIAVAVIDTATLQVKQSVPIAEVSVVFGLGLSPDGSQIYISGQADFQGTDIFTLDLATQALTAFSVVVNGGVAVSPDGSVYVGNTMNNIAAGSQVLVFDPVSQSVTRKLSAYGYGMFALDPAGSKLYYLNQQSSTLAEAAAPPSPSMLGTAAIGQLDSAAYDATNNLLLAADTANNIEVLDATTLAPAGHLFVPLLNNTNPYVTANGGFGFVTLDGNVPEVLQFDPVSRKVTGRVSLPNRPYDLVSFSPPAMNGSTLYVPFSFSFNGAQTGSGGPPSSGVPKNGIAVIDTLQMKRVATWTFPSMPLIGLAQGSTVGYAVLPAGDDELDVEEIDLSTGAIVASAQVPGAASYFSNPAVSPDGSTVYLFSGSTLYVFNAQTLAITNTVTGVALTNLAVSPDGSYLYGGTTVPCTDCSEQIISTSSLMVVGTIPVSTAYPQPVLFIGN